MVIQCSLLLLLLLTLQDVDSCQGPEVVRELVLAKVKALFLDALGPPAMDGEGGSSGIRRLPRRHALGGFMHRTSEAEKEDVSQAILFPATGNEVGAWQVNFEKWLGAISWAWEPGRSGCEWQPALRQLASS